MTNNGAHVMESTYPTVLIIDDDNDLRDWVRETLLEAGYPTLEAADGTAALDLLRAQATPLVVLVDMMLPGLNGTKLLDIVAHNHHLAVVNAYIVMTGRPRIAFPATWQVAKTIEALTLDKPFTAEDLLSAVATCGSKLVVPPSTSEAQDDPTIQ
ncbi:MAG: response regulator [Ktedonobacterales bacterium]|nr:response regulator [Ktedonobacterales bacterium]